MVIESASTFFLNIGGRFRLVIYFIVTVVWLELELLTKVLATLTDRISSTDRSCHLLRQAYCHTLYRLIDPRLALLLGFASLLH